MRKAEGELGFRQGSIHVPGEKSEPYYKVVIRSVVKGGAFDQAGIRAGDILPELEGCAVPDSPQTALSKLPGLQTEPFPRYDISGQLFFSLHRLCIPMQQRHVGILFDRS